MRPLEFIIFLLVLTGVFGIAIISAKATQIQKTKQVVYPWGWFAFGCLPIVYVIWQLIQNANGSISSLAVILLIVDAIEAVIAFILIRKLIAPAVAQINQEEKIRLEKEQAQAKADEPLIERMNYCKAMERKAQYGLSLMKGSKKFQQEAEDSGMNVEDYRQWCKDAIAEYEELVRKYNETHVKRWEY